MADEVADSLATLNDVTDRGVPYSCRMGDPCRRPTGPTSPHSAPFPAVPWSPLSVLLLRASSVTTWA
jgi:hypothetical protein